MAAPDSERPKKQQKIKKHLETRPLATIKPYENNPRHNQEAVMDVVESIKQCEYISPIIVDENGVILAGHTRYKAFLYMEYAEIEVLVVEGLTEAQKRKYRILDNKTNERATWDFEMLEVEIEDLDFEGYDFGFDLDSFMQETEGGTPDEPFDFDGERPAKELEPKEIMCPHCKMWFVPK